MSDAGLGDVSLACASALVNELVRGGMRHACCSPGSRSTPLALALARRPDVVLHVHLDERASAFFALGVAKASNRIVAVACTSGTAAAELFPAVVEASQSRTPLVLLTADRPPELRGTGANQTIDQVELFGTYARAYLEPPEPRTPADVPAWAHAGEAAVLSARYGEVDGEEHARSPGPVQVNCPFGEPLVPAGEWRPDLTVGEPLARGRTLAGSHPRSWSRWFGAPSGGWSSSEASHAPSPRCSSSRSGSTGRFWPSPPPSCAFRAGPSAQGSC